MAYRCSSHAHLAGKQQLIWAVYYSGSSLTSRCLVHGALQWSRINIGATKLHLGGCKSDSERLACRQTSHWGSVVSRVFKTTLMVNIDFLVTTVWAEDHFLRIYFHSCRETWMWVCFFCRLRFAHVEINKPSDLVGNYLSAHLKK